MVKSISRPEGNTTGFAYLFLSIGGKWLEFLREAAPHVTRVGIPSNPIMSGGYNPSAEAAAVQFGLQTTIMSVRNATETERAIEAFAAAPNGGLIVSPSARVGGDHGLISRLAIQYRLPAIYYDKSHVAEGGLMSYGPDTALLFRGGASYVDRILRGAHLRDLPVQGFQRVDCGGRPLPLPTSKLPGDRGTDFLGISDRPCGSGVSTAGRARLFHERPEPPRRSDPSPARSLPPGEPLPTADGDIDVAGVDLQSVHATTDREKWWRRTGRF